MKLKHIIPIILIFVIGCIAYRAYSRYSDHRGQTPLKADAKDLKGTIVTPHLQQKMVPGKNILWCSTFQLAWNELRSLAKGPVTLDPYNPETEILNNSPVSKSDIDSSAYVAAAGFVEDGIVEQIKTELNQKFQGQIQSELLRDSSQLEGIVAYANLYKSLPFRHPFDRINDASLAFLGNPVQSFGISENKIKGIKYAPVAAQVVIIDLMNKDDFIIGLETTDYNNQLILAKVPPLSTLQETMKMVQARCKKIHHNNRVNMQSLHVPVIDFDILKQYDELVKHTIKASDKRVNGQPLDIAAQSIQFRLDEYGAAIRSESMIAGMAGMMMGIQSINLDFDKPFLVLVKHVDSKNPFFALWVGNTELLFPVK